MKKLFSVRKIVCLCLALLMTFSLFTVSAAPAVDTINNASGETELEGYELVAESKGTQMFADMSTGLFKLVTADGNVYNSISDSKDNDEITVGKNRMAYASQLIVDYAVIDGFGLGGLINTTNSSISCGKEVENIKNGIRVEYNFSVIDSVIPVEYVLVTANLTLPLSPRILKRARKIP